MSSLKWRVIPDWEEYEISECGDVRRVKSGRGARSGLILRPWINPRTGYLQVTLWHRNRRSQQSIHRLVALAFWGAPPSSKHVVAHVDGSRTNNHWRNLRWATQRENMADRIRHGTANCGSRNGQARLDETCVLAIRKMGAGLVPKAFIADGYGISRQTVDDVLSRRRWKHLDCPPSSEREPRQ